MSGKNGKKAAAAKKLTLKYKVFDFDTIFGGGPASTFMLSLGRISSLDFRVPTTIKLDGMVQDIEDKQEQFARLKKKLCEEHGKKNDDGGFDIDDDKKEAFKEKYEELCEQKFTIPHAKLNLPDSISLKRYEVKTTRDLFEFVPDKKEA